MSTDVVHVEPEVPAERRKHKVYRHPDRLPIEALLRRGKSAYWISCWLEEVYPVNPEPENDAERAASDTNKRKQIGLEELDEYRDAWIPEAAPGVDVVHDQIDDIVGRRFPGSTKGRDFELELMDMTIDVAQHMLGQALDQDDKLKMGVSETTIQAHQELLATVKASVDLKQQLGLAGYEAPAAKHKIESHSTHTQKNYNVNLHGAFDPRTGELGPADPARVDAILGLLAATRDQAAEVLEATVADEAERPGT